MRLVDHIGATTRLRDLATSKSRSHELALCLLVTAASACAPASRPAPPPAAEGATCVLAPPPVVTRDTIVVGVTAPIDPANVARPRTHEERLVFGALYEPLVRADCERRLLPALAASWARELDGRTWTLALRDSARFSDGTPVTAEHLARSLTSNGLSGVSAGSGASTLRVVADDSANSLPAYLAAEPVALERQGTSFPLGTGSHRPESDGAGLLRLVPTGEVRAPVIVLRRAPGADARDLIDAGADLLITGAPSVLAYAATRPDLETVPLPWDRTYVLLAPGRLGSRGTAGQDSATTTQRAALGELLARDAARSDARAAAGPSLLDQAAGCRLTSEAPAAGGHAPPPRAARIVYADGDPVAKGLAERLVALAAIGSGAGAVPGAPALDTVLPELRPAAARLTAAPLPAPQLAASLRAGNELAYLVSVPHRPLSPCAEMRQLGAAAPWLGGAAAGRAVVPLVDTRSHLVLRRGAVGVSVDADGTLRLLAAPDTAP